MTLSSSIGLERTPVRGSSPDDLDQESIQDFLERRIPRSLRDKLPPDQLLERIGLLGKSGQTPLPTVAGLVAFGYCPQLSHPEWGLSALRIKGLVISDPIEEREDLEGSLTELLEAGLGFIAEHTQSVADQLERSREVVEEYPRQAVREALVNALVHRDFGLSGRVAIRIFDDRLELWSPGGPLPSIQATLEELSAEGGVSLPRNPLIASTGRCLGMGEQVGRGLPALRRSISESTGYSVSILASKTEVCVVIPSTLRAHDRAS